MMRSIWERQTGHPKAFIFTSVKQAMQPAKCPHGTHAASTGASLQIKHDELERLVPSPALIRRSSATISGQVLSLPLISSGLPKLTSDRKEAALAKAICASSEVNGALVAFGDDGGQHGGVAPAVDNSNEEEVF